MNSRIFLPALACFSILFPFSAVVYAQTSSSDSSGSRVRTAIEEIVVTARRREENLQEIPDAVTAFTSQAIEDAGIDKIDDALALTPNIDIRNDQQPGVFTMTVRGVSQVRNGRAPVAFVVDNVSMPGRNFMTLDLFDVERIEILKGPQGALYGQNAIGGAINITTKKPTNEFEGNLKFRAANGDDYTVRGSFSGPLVKDKLLFRIAGMYRDKGGLLTNEFLNRKVDSEETKTVRAKLLYTPSDELTIDLRGFYHDSEQEGGYYKTVGPATFFAPFPPNGPARLPLNQKLGKIVLDIPTPTPVKAKGGSIKIDWETNHGTLTSTSAYQQISESIVFDLDFTASSTLEGAGKGLTTDFESYNQEIRFTSPGDQRLRWFAGVFYQQIDRLRTGSPSLNLNALGGNFDPAQKFLKVLPTGIDFVEDWTSYAFFGQVNYDVLDNLELTLALRYDTWKDNTFQRNPSGLRLKDTFRDIQPKLSLAYSWDEDLMTYLTISRGWRPGGFNNVNTIQVEYKEETLWNYEVGFKSSFYGNRLTVNGAAFYIDYSDPQFFIVDASGGGPIQTIFNGQGSRIYGFDLEIHALTPIEGLELGAGFGVLDHKLESIGANITTLFPLVSPGKKLPNIADHNINLSAQYTRPVSNAFDFVGRLDFKRTGKTFWTLDNIGSEGAYNLVDLRGSLVSDKWKITAFVENVFDEEYTQFQFQKSWTSFAADIAWPSTPRYYGIEIGYHY